MWFWPVCWFPPSKVCYHHVVLPLMFVSRFLRCMDLNVFVQIVVEYVYSSNTSLALLLSRTHYKNSGSYSNMEYTFGGTYNGGNRAEVSGYDRTSTLQGSISFEPERVNAKMYQHVASNSACLAVPSGVSPLDSTPHFSRTSHLTHVESCLSDSQSNLSPKLRPQLPLLYLKRLLQLPLL